MPGTARRRTSRCIRSHWGKLCTPSAGARGKEEPRLRALIAEDDAVSRVVLKRTVEASDHECLAAEDGLEAWETYCRRPDVDVIISDWMMPEYGWAGVLQEGARARADGYTFFIFLTAPGAGSTSWRACRPARTST